MRALARDQRYRYRTWRDGFRAGRHGDPAAFVKSGLDGIDLHLATEITAISREGDGFVLHHQAGEIVADTLIMAAGAGLAALAEPHIPDCRFQIMGHVTHLEPTAFSLNSGLSFGGYMARAADGTIALGASFDHHDLQKPLPPRGKAAHQANFDLLPGGVKDHLPAAGDHLPGRTSLRLASPDRQPVAGRLGAGLYVLSGLGARGMVTAPILGEYIASLVLGLPSPLDAAMEAVIDPGRFSAARAIVDLGHQCIHLQNEPAQDRGKFLPSRLQLEFCLVKVECPADFNLQG